MRILVADDDRAVRDALRRALTLGGYEVALAEGGRQSLEAVAASTPDAIVLDIGMPDVDGLEVCRRLRRAGADGDPDVLRFAELQLDAGRHGVRVGDTFVELTRTEYQLLELLMLNPRRVLPHTLIYDRVWGYDFGPASNGLRVYVGYLRRKLEEAGARPLIHTIRGVGYVLREP